MIVVFEGPDGAGKSTLIEHLVNVYETERAIAAAGPSGVTSSVWSRGPFPDGSDAWAEYLLPASGLFPCQDWLVVMDRWHLGELVYGPLLRGQSRLSAPQRGYVDAFLHHVGAVMVYLTATSEMLARRLGERGDDLIKTEQLPTISLAYDRVFKAGQTHLTVLRYDTTGQRPEPTATAILKAAKLETGVALSRWNHPSSDKRPFWEQHAWPT